MHPENNRNGNALASANRDLFAKARLDLMQILPPRWVLLYGRIQFHEGKDGICFATHRTLASEIGLKDRKYVIKLLARLQALRLIERVKRLQYSVAYRTLPPDIAFLKAQMSPGDDISDVAFSPPPLIGRKEVLGLKEGQPAKQNSGGSTHQEGTGEDRQAAATPSQNENAQAENRTGPEAAIRDLLIEAWGFPGGPGQKLLADVQAALGSTPLDHFRACLDAARDRAHGYGLALKIAQDAARTWTPGGPIPRRRPARQDGYPSAEWIIAQLSGESS